MKLADVLETQNLEHSVLIGYYGGGNYGDELLLEVLASLLKSKGIRNVTITYQTPPGFLTFHHESGYSLIKMSDKKSLMRTILRNKNILVGGGGLWGLDVNANIFLFSLVLFASRWLLGKKVYLLGVGYYNSTSKLGRASAWLAGKSAKYIVARDAETLQNFQKISKRVAQDDDIAWSAPKLNLTDYQADLDQLEGLLRISGKTLFITLRRFQPSQKNEYARVVEHLLADNKDKKIIIALMEPQNVDPAGYKLIRNWAVKYKNIQAIDFSYNPLGLFLFFQKYHDQLALIGPQFHIIITARLAGVPFLPISYDNKVSQLLQSLGIEPIPIGKLSAGDAQRFIDDFYGAGS
ncbi:MAG TPA: polysaccharide pyruvyl transferase family protein [Candidatus Acidoferrum sp.]|nr:polysaccharide pyruvyl transferase family protein [Candidatus Acidoferrum sp.]